MTPDDAVTAVTDLQHNDPRPAALLDAIWPRLQAPDQSDDELYERFCDLAAAVLMHYGYRVDRTGLPPIDPIVAAAVRVARLPESMGCHWCSAPKGSHGTRYVPYIGKHGWTEPDEEQRELRIRALIVELEREYAR